MALLQLKQLSLKERLGVHGTPVGFGELREERAIAP